MIDIESFTKDDEEHITHIKLIGAGGYGEVHQVMRPYFQRLIEVDARRTESSGELPLEDPLKQPRISQGNF